MSLDTENILFNFRPQDMTTGPSTHQSDSSLYPTQQQKQPQLYGTEAVQDANRVDKINALRAEHQRRHRERHGRYPHEKEDDYTDSQVVLLIYYLVLKK